jgi:tetratricopeptide (TPR) repeat protein
LEIDSTFYLLWLIIGGSQLGAGLLEEAIVSLEKAVELAPWYSLAIGYLAAAHYQAGNRERSSELAHKLVDWRANSFGAAVYHAAAGETDAMFAALEEAYRQRDFEVRTLPNLERFDPYRKDARFQAILQRLHL